MKALIRFISLAMCRGSVLFPALALLTALALQITVYAQTPGVSAQASNGAGTIQRSETGFGPTPFFNHVGPGADFDVTGVTTRIHNPITMAPQTEPFVLTGPVVPSGATVIESFISWNYLTEELSPPATDSITVNGNVIVGTQTGSGIPDLLWDKEAGVTYLAQGVTSFLVFNGPNTIAGATDKALGSDPDAYGEGISILVVYEVDGELWRNVDVYAGYTSTESYEPRGKAVALFEFSNTYEQEDLHFFINALDGEEYIGPDDFYINGMRVSGGVAGTVQKEDAWQGLLGPSSTGIDNLYDQADDDISIFITPPADDMTVTTELPLTYGDSIGHTLGAVSFLTETLAPPEIDEVSPSSGSMEGGTLITVSGHYFVAGTNVLVNRLPAANVLIVDSKIITCRTPANTIPGPVDVEVLNGNGTDILANGFLYLPPAGSPPMNLTDVDTLNLYPDDIVRHAVTGKPGKKFIVFLSLGGGPKPTPWGVAGLSSPIYFGYSWTTNAFGYYTASLKMPANSAGYFNFFTHALVDDGPPVWATGGNNPNGTGSIMWGLN